MPGPVWLRLAGRQCRGGARRRPRYGSGTLSSAVPRANACLAQAAGPFAAFGVAAPAARQMSRCRAPLSPEWFRHAEQRCAPRQRLSCASRRSLAAFGFAAPAARQMSRCRAPLSPLWFRHAEQRRAPRQRLSCSSRRTLCGVRRRSVRTRALLLPPQARVHQPGRSFCVKRRPEERSQPRRRGRWIGQRLGIFDSHHLHARPLYRHPSGP